MATAFQSNAFQNNAFQVDGAVVVDEDTNDGGREEAKRFREKKERLREALEFAFYGKTKVADEIRELVVPHVDSPVIELDWDAMSAKAVEALLEAQERYEAYMLLDDEEAITVLH